MKLVDGFIVRKIVDEWVAVPTGTRTADFSGLISLSDTGKFLWELLETEKTERELITALTDEYEIDVQTASIDVMKYLEYLRDQKLILE